jgi:prophage DNA circulation protein
MPTTTELDQATEIESAACDVSNAVSSLRLALKYATGVNEDLAPLLKALEAIDAKLQPLADAAEALTREAA